MKIQEIIQFLDEVAPLYHQESYDNAGLIVGAMQNEVKAILITIDVTEEIIDEAIQRGANLIVAHHPIVFSGLKRFNGNNYVERVIIQAIKNDIAIYAAHTNLDSVLHNGVNSKICEKLELQKLSILDPVKDNLNKLSVFVPVNDAEKVRSAIFNAGGGTIGNYDSCSFNTNGTGTFKPSDNTNPHVGKKHILHAEPEMKIETIVPQHITNKVVRAMLMTHPYEEVAYDIYPLKNTWNMVGAGMLGELLTPLDETEMLLKIKQIFNCQVIRHTRLLNKKIKKIAVCGGAGSFLLKQAIKAGADLFITGDFKYHQFFDAENQIIIADIGHFESEQFTKELFYELLTRKFSNFAIYLTNVNTNPIKYL